MEIVAENKDATVSEEPEVDGYAISLEVASRTLRIGQISGITDYNLLDNLPSIGGKTLKGDKDAHDLGLATVEDNAAKVDKVDGKGLSANDLTDERAAKVDKVTLDGSPNEYLNGEGGYSRPVRQGYGVTVDPDGTVHADPQVVARQSDVAAVAADLAAQKAKEQGDVDSLAGRIADEESGRAAAVAALQALIDTLNGDSNVDGSVKRTVSEAIAKVVAGAPEDLDTLKEIADYIASDKTGAAEMAAAVSALQALTKGHTADIEANAAGVAENMAGVKANSESLSELEKSTDGRISGVEALDERMKTLLGYNAARSVVNLTAGAAGKYVQCASRSAVAAAGQGDSCNGATSDTGRKGDLLERGLTGRRETLHQLPDVGQLLTDLQDRADRSAERLLGGRGHVARRLREVPRGRLRRRDLLLEAGRVGVHADF